MSIVLHLTYKMTPNLATRFQAMHKDVIASAYSYLLLQWDVCHKLDIPYQCIKSHDIVQKFPVTPNRANRWQWNACDSVYLYWFHTQKQSFNLFWIVEYDVVWTGSPSQFFKLVDQAYPNVDFIGPHVSKPGSDWPHINKIVGKNALPWRHSLVQMVRVSRHVMSKTVSEIAVNQNWRYCEAQIPTYSRSVYSWRAEYGSFFGDFSWNTNVNLTALPHTNATRFYHRSKDMNPALEHSTQSTHKMLPLKKLYNYLKQRLPFSPH